MATATEEDENLGQTAMHIDRLKGSTVLEEAQSLWHELLGLTHDHLLLAALETRHAGESLVSMMMAGIMVVFLLGGAWVGLMAVAVFGLINNGILVSNAVLLAVAVNLLFALALIAVIRRKSRSLQFPATLRSLNDQPQASG